MAKPAKLMEKQMDNENTVHFLEIGNLKLAAKKSPMKGLGYLDETPYWDESSLLSS